MKDLYFSEYKEQISKKKAHNPVEKKKTKIWIGISQKYI